MKEGFVSLGGKPAVFSEYARRVSHVKSIVVNTFGEKNSDGD